MHVIPDLKFEEGGNRAAAETLCIHEFRQYERKVRFYMMLDMGAESVCAWQRVFIPIFSY